MGTSAATWFKHTWWVFFWDGCVRLIPYRRHKLSIKSNWIRASESQDIHTVCSWLVLILCCIELLVWMTGHDILLRFLYFFLFCVTPFTQIIWTTSLLATKLLSGLWTARLSVCSCLWNVSPPMTSSRLGDCDIKKDTEGSHSIVREGGQVMIVHLKQMQPHSH